MQNTHEILTKKEKDYYILYPKTCNFYGFLKIHKSKETQLNNSHAQKRKHIILEYIAQFAETVE